jgi:hypothetical protein
MGYFSVEYNHEILERHERFTTDEHRWTQVGKCAEEDRRFLPTPTRMSALPGEASRLGSDAFA